MLPEQRRQQIVATLGTRGMVRADDLAQRLGVSLETVRRDLQELERRGELTRVYGGATRASRTEQPPYESRRRTRRAAKQAIGRFAASLVQPRQTVIYDLGTTVHEAARAVPTGLTGHAVTNSTRIAEELSRRAGLRVQLTPGTPHGTEEAMSGPATEAFLASVYADVVFLGAGGVHPDVGLTDFHPAEVAARQVMLERAIERYVLADSDKLGRVASLRVCDMTAFTAVVTDSAAPRTVVTALAARGIRVHVVPVVAEQAGG
ncbi:MAG TPA: DeoR/GlpR family DNA-binding transcription regulator [Cryptosporangiaceae bacterium]|nr:DeoR/GlpR family DNA-binding transcription regulator [Cryptosporangiaceae bacterium]